MTGFVPWCLLDYRVVHLWERGLYHLHTLIVVVVADVLLGLIIAANVKNGGNLAKSVLFHRWWLETTVPHSGFLQLSRLINIQNARLKWRIRLELLEQTAGMIIFDRLIHFLVMQFDYALIAPILQVSLINIIAARTLLIPVVLFRVLVKAFLFPDDKLVLKGSLDGWLFLSECSLACTWLVQALLWLVVVLEVLLKGNNWVSPASLLIIDMNRAKFDIFLGLLYNLRRLKSHFVD